MRGSVPIFLVILPVISPGPITTSFFNLVFVIVVISLLAHGLTTALAARWLGVETDPATEPYAAASKCDDGHEKGRPGYPERPLRRIGFRPLTRSRIR